jgi:hypothetical protein
MSRSKRKASRRSGHTAIDRARSIPWAVLLRVSIVVGSRWRRLSDKDRQRLVRMMRESRGRVTRLGPKERDELRRMVRKADLKGMGAELLALRGARRRGRRR